MKNRIEELMTERGLTIRPLAKKMGISPSQVCRLISGDRKLTIEWLLKFSAALDVPPNEIVNIEFGTPTTATCDQALMGSVIGFVYDACHQYGLSPAPKEMAAWVAFIYNDTVRHNLSVKETRDLAESIIKITQKSAGNTSRPQPRKKRSA